MWLLRGWISERLKQSIQHEYSQKLETHKADLNTRIQSLQHENQLHQLRTSLFFDHQRNAFASLLSKITEVNQEWEDKEYEEYVGVAGRVPSNALSDLYKVYHQHQLFLDVDCIETMELTFECYHDSISPIGDSAEQDDIEASYNGIQYLQTMIVELFRKKLEASNNDLGLRKIAIFGAIKLLNKHRDLVPELKLFSGEPLRLLVNNPANAVMKAEQNFNELLSKLKALQTYGQTQSRRFDFLHFISVNASKYLAKLDSVNID